MTKKLQYTQTFPITRMARRLRAEEAKAYKRAYYQRPEVKAHKKAYMRAYYQRPEVKAYMRAYNRAYYQKNKDKWKK